MSYQNKNVRRSAPKKTKRMWWVAAIALVVILLAFGGYWKFGRNHNTKPAVSANSETKGEPANSGASSNTNTPGTTDTSSGSAPTQNQPPSTSSGTKQEQNPPQTSGVTLQVPTGNFVSSHGKDQPVPSSAVEDSTCTTTPGATCVITFTQGSVTHSLPPQSTDRGGTAYWHWTISQYLTSGSWTITATATLNGQTQSATDQLPLKVQ